MNILRPVIYFTQPGELNTRAALEAAAERARAGDIRKALVASTRGNTGRIAMDILTEIEVVVVSHSYGFKEINKQEFTCENREAIEGRGGVILTCQHAFGGVGRAVRKKFGGTELEEVVAHTLRNFGDGTKVAVEITLMAAEAGLVNHGENIIAIGGSNTGADTALVVKAANVQYFFDLRIQEYICKPIY
ncbi:hypothetical protein ISS30_06650 [bacterium]|nr:hypothetical protein [bacterium]